MKKLLTVLLGFILFFGIVFGFQDSTSAKNNEPRLRVFVHYPNPHGPVIASSCQLTSNDQVTDYGLAGWHMPNAGMTYNVNYSSKPSNLTNDQVYTAVANSFVTWTASDPKQIFNYGGSTFSKNARYDGTNAILWKPIGKSAIAITYVWYYVSSGQLAETDTIFNKNYQWNITSYNGTNDCGGIAGTYDVQNIATHEFGHWVGLDDLYSSVDQDLTMYGYGDTTELKKDTLGKGDILGVNSVAP